MTKVPRDTRTILQRLKVWKEAVNQHGGVFNSVVHIYRTDELKEGTHVGTDEHGNKYYHNPRYFFGRSRWVVYADEVGMDYTGSGVPAEWHRWLHYIGDEVPNPKAGLAGDEAKKTKWLAEHKDNMTGTSNQYVPYSTTRPKVNTWKPN